MKALSRYIIATPLEEKNITDGGLVIQDQQSIPPKATVVAVPVGIEGLSEGDVVLYYGRSAVFFMKDVNDNQNYLAIEPHDVIAILPQCPQ
jgi:co-chaperonin GroES (HSP10)